MYYTKMVLHNLLVLMSFSRAVWPIDAVYTWLTDNPQIFVKLLCLSYPRIFVNNLVQEISNTWHFTNRSFSNTRTETHKYINYIDKTFLIGNHTIGWKSNITCVSHIRCLITKSKSLHITQSFLEIFLEWNVNGWMDV